MFLTCFQSNSEITYAELCLDNSGNAQQLGVVVGANGVPPSLGIAVPNNVGGGVGGVGAVMGNGGGGGWTTSTVDRKRRRNSPMGELPPPSNAVIYATIDHCRRTNNGEPPSHHHLHHHTTLQPHQREIVSVRTPLLVNSTQESCV